MSGTVDKGSSLYLNHYEALNHEQLSEELHKANSRWILTYDHVPEITELYKNKPNYPFSLNYSADKFKIGKELLVHSDSLKLPHEYLETK